MINFFTKNIWAFFIVSFSWLFGIAVLINFPSSTLATILAILYFCIGMAFSEGTFESNLFQINIILILGSLFPALAALIFAIVKGLSGTF